MTDSAAHPLIRRAMVLAAGLGKRMRPISATTPKPLVELGGKALIDHGLDRLAAVGVDTVVVNVHYLADLVEFHVGRRSHPRIIVSDERDQLLDTGGGIRRALPYFDDEPFFVFNSDSSWIEGVRPNLSLLAEAWDDAAMDVLLMLSPTVSAVGYDGLGDFSMDGVGRLMRRKPQRIAPFVYAGAAILSPRAFADTPAVEPFSLNLVLDKAIDAGRLYGTRMEGMWLHVGTPEAITEAEAAIEASAA
ncbi:MAG: nucleotidyltransferase family protein [Ancalomicrobiaceae bacterium]|nr:nucleotidyltransferase family protein [Ancalomicrobiaceae bacterium]